MNERNILLASVWFGPHKPIDYMHAVLEGVMKSLMNRWFKDSNKPYLLQRYTSSINQKMLHYLPSEYIYHLSLLVHSMHKLLSTAISLHELDQVQQQLNLFHDLVPQLYDASLCTANVHSLCHLTTQVRYWEPLWSVSAFGFESINGVLKRQIHGTRQVLHQAVSVMNLRKMLYFKKASSCGSSNNSIIVGKCFTKSFSSELSAYIGVPTAVLFLRAKIGSTV
uniref:DUF4218 domain-containing protein n=1 Tax=Amphimedon queenslandica TaxID=400682 RepID=A0A1X7T0J0_AMPQE